MDRKSSEGKNDFTLIPPDVHEEVAQIFTEGGKQYGDYTWKNINPQEYEKALYRHWNAHLKGEKKDKKSRKLHISHVIANGYIIAWHEKNGGAAIEEE